MPARRVVSGESITLDGYTELQKALADVDPVLKKQLTKSLKEAGTLVATDAEHNVSHRTGRHGGDGQELEKSIKVSSTSGGVSLWSGALHAGVQDQGGQVGRGHATTLKRSDVSQYMTRAVDSKTPRVEEMIQEAVDASTEAAGF